jgi:hypothetical protein
VTGKSFVELVPSLEEWVEVKNMRIKMRSTA